MNGESLTPFVPGMAMKDCLVVTKEVCRDDLTLRGWLEQHSAYLMSSPPKLPYTRKKKRGR